MARRRGPRITALSLRVSPVILVYMPPSGSDAGPRGPWALPLLHLLRSALDRPVVLGSRCGGRTCSTHAGASTRNEFQQVETRAGGPRPRRVRIVQVPS